MSTQAIYPFILKPAYKDYIWGGDRIPARFNRHQPPGIYAESWELSDRLEGMSHVANGPLENSSLADLAAEFGPRLLGHGIKTSTFPILVKLIDARERLSIQVHPDGEAAIKGFGEAKTEAWHILDASKGAHVFAGLKPGTDKVTFLGALKKNQLEEHLQRYDVAAGETLFIPGGCVHAICEGLLLLEVQQNSNTTYRVYDWGRLDQRGNPRELHLKEALKVIRWDAPPSGKTLPRTVSDKPGAGVVELVASPYFRLEKLDITAPFCVHHDGSSFHALFTLDGGIKIMSEAGAETIPAGRTCLVPAALDRYTLKPSDKRATILRISVPTGC